MFCRPVIHKKGEELAKDIKVPDGLNCSDHKTVKLKILEKKKINKSSRITWTWGETTLACSGIILAGSHKSLNWRTKVPWGAGWPSRTMSSVRVVYASMQKAADIAEDPHWWTAESWLNISKTRVYAEGRSWDGLPGYFPWRHCPGV